MDIKKFVLLIVVTFQVGIVFGAVPCGNAKIEYHLNRANSLHWLSRSRENSVFEANCSKKHVDSAYQILTESDMESACKIEYTKQINSFYTELDELIGVSLDNLNGKYPLVPFITKQYNQFEYYDVPLETSAEAAISKLLESGIYRPSKELKEVLLFCVVEAQGDQALKEVAIQYLNIHSRMYVISDHEITKILGEVTALNDSLLSVLGASFGTNYIGKLTLSEIDNSPEVSYVGAKFEFFNLLKKEKISDTYSEGMKVGMAGRLKPFIPYVLWLFIASLFLTTILFLVLKKYLGEAGTWPNYGLATLIGLLLGAGSSLGLIQLFSLFVPQGAEFIGEPMPMVWPYLFSISHVLTPVILFILSGFIFKRRFSDSLPLIFVFLFFNSVFLIIPLLKAQFQYLESAPNLKLISYFILAATTISLGAAEWLRSGYKRKKNYVFLITGALFFIPLGLLYHELLRSGSDSLGGIENVSMVLAILSGSIPFILLRRKVTVKETDKQEREMLQLVRFSKLINTQLTAISNHILVEFNEGYETKLNQICEASNGVTHLHIHGSPGIGKTTLLNSFLESNKDLYFSFYGDCDEDQEGATTPYEPFYESFSEVIGTGLFYDGSQAASDLLTKASPLLDIVGVGGVAEVLSKSSDSFEGASVNEIATGILNHLQNLSKKYPGKHIFIVIEDIHWIDDYTKSLLNLMLSQFIALSHKKRNETKIMVITTSSTDNDLKYRDILEASQHLQENDDVYNFVSWSNSEQDNLKIDNLSNRNFTKKFLSTAKSGLLFSPKAILEIDQFLSQNATVNPRYILELIKYLIDNKVLIEEDNVISIKNDFNWDSVPAESQIEELYYSQFINLPENVLKVLESAAFIGMEFEADLLSKLWKLDRLDLIHNLLRAEKSGIIIDLNDEDDKYRFGSKAIRAALKRFSLTNTGVKGNVPQIVKEYHKEIIRITLDNYEINKDVLNISLVPNDVLFKLAERTMLVHGNNPERGLMVCNEALKRAIVIGDSKNIKQYLTFLSLAPLELILKSNETSKYFLKGVQFMLSSNAKEYEEILGEKLYTYLQNILLTKSIDDKDEIQILLETYYELSLKLYSDSAQLGFLNARYQTNFYTRFYKLLIDRKNNDYKFTDQSIEDLKQLWNEIEFLEDDNLKGKVLGNLASVSSAEDSIHYLTKRVNIIAEDCAISDGLLGIILCLDQKINSFNFEQLNDLGFVCFSLNNYFTQLKLTTEKFHLNQLRLKINNKLNHRLGVFVSSLELISQPVDQENNQLYSFSEDLFYQFTESTYRVQMYPIWLLNTLNSKDSHLISELSVSTQVMINDMRKEDFLPIEMLKWIRLPKSSIEECLAHTKLKNKERQVLEKIYGFCS